MFKRFLFSVLILLVLAVPAIAQERGLEKINREDLYRHLEFIASDEMKGRNTPSPELKMAARYLAVQAKSIGLDPLMDNGTYFQNIPLEISTVSEAQSVIHFESNNGSRTFGFPADFSVGRPRDISVSGEVVFAGLGLVSKKAEWDDYSGLDCEGKIAVILDVDFDDNHPLSGDDYRGIKWGRGSYARNKGAVAILTVISRKQEEMLAESGRFFDNNQVGKLFNMEGRSGRTPGLPSLGLRHDAAAELLGITREALNSLMEDAASGTKLENYAISGSKVSIDVAVNKRNGYTSNVVAWLEGSDPVLKDEFVVFGSHYDHVGTRNGQVYNGADDDGSGTVAMLEIAEAMVEERPKRSVVFVWHTGEEKGLWGARHFVNNSPVPVHKVNAMLQMDMLSRNDPDSIYIIGSHFLSSKLDALNREAAEELGLIELNDLYNDPNKRRNYFHQSDHYAYHQAGIPTTFFFCGVHEDLHSPTDTIEKCNFDKMERVTKLVYLVGMKVGNWNSLFKLDRDPEIKNRGKKGKENR